MSTTTSSTKKEMPVDEYLHDTVTRILAPFHAAVSEKNIKLQDADLDLAMDKIGQAMTAIQRRLNARRKDGTYGKESI